MVASDDQVKICVIDLRLGKHEENPEEQLLGAWSYRQQTESAMMDIVRLARGSIGLCSHFQTVRSFVNQLMYAGPSRIDVHVYNQANAGTGRIQFGSLVRYIRSSHHGHGGHGDVDRMDYIRAYLISDVASVPRACSVLPAQY